MSHPMLRNTLLCLVTALFAASCAIREDAAPRNITNDELATFGQIATGDAAAGERTIYLLAPNSPDDQPQLRSVRRQTTAEPKQVLESLVNGVNVAENAAGLSSAIPPELQIVSARTVGTRLTIDINDALSELSDSGLREALAQIVATASEIDQVQQIRLRVNGENRSWPTGNGDVSDQPLTIYDYPGFLETSQPAFTALPSA